MHKVGGSGFFWWILVGLWIMSLFFLSGWWGYRLVKNEYLLWEDYLSGDDFSLDDTQKAMEEIYSLVSSQYYFTGDVDKTKMARQAIASFVNWLGDPFSSYLPPLEAKELEDNISGDESIEGIWAMLSQTEKGIIIEEVVHSSPAAQVGLMPLDIIVKVNGTGIQDQNVQEVVQLIRWPKGTSVDLTVMRMNDEWWFEIIEKTLIRDAIVIPSVSSKILSGDKWQKIGYIWLSVFASDTDSRLKKEITKLLDENIQGVILDVRGNGGWLLPESVSVVSHFLKQGSSVTKAKYRIYNDDDYKAEWWDMLSHLPLVVLTNWYSASASEIIALALRENRCPWSTSLSVQEQWSGSVLWENCTAVLVWERTFGKWTVQSLQNLQFGWSLKLTVGKWFSPSGISIHELGILPDYVVELNAEEYYGSWNDAQLEKAEELLSQYLTMNR